MANSDHEILSAIYTDMQTMKTDMQTMKADMQTMKADMQTMKADMDIMKTDIQEVKQRTTRLEISLETETNRNIKLLAENHGTLIDKLNQAIKVSDKTTLYEIQVNILTGKVDRLEQEIAEIKNRIA